MNIIVDTNIIFSGLLNPNGKISDLLLNSTESFEFFAPTFIFEKLERHHPKMIHISGFSEEEISFLKRMLFKKIEFIDVDIIRTETWQRAISLVQDIDEFDAPLIALSLELEALLWTGDNKLRNGLMRKNINWILETNMISEIRDKR